MSANKGPLKPGQLCWMTKTIAFNIGKVVEVIDFCQTLDGIDVYHVTNKQPMLLDNTDGTIQLSTGLEFHAWRDQLIPFADPDKDLEDELQQENGCSNVVQHT